MRFWTALLIALTISSGSSFAAGDPLAGKKKVAKCVTCHGRDGIAKIPNAPNLAGQKADYLLRSFTSYKSGDRRNEQMKIITQTVTEADLADILAYYAAIKITVEVPE